MTILKKNTGETTATALLMGLGDHQFDILHCRCQSYSNTVNMSGKNKRMQVLFGEKSFIVVCVMLKLFS